MLYKRVALDKMREIMDSDSLTGSDSVFGFHSVKGGREVRVRRLPVCPVCRGDMEVWAGDVFVCEGCEDFENSPEIDFGEWDE